MLSVKIDKFEGPLHLLLKLIEKEELDITEISLAKIADEYIELVESSPAIGPGEMADFLVLAARLLYIKSKALFPHIDLPEEEGGDDLEKQLRMYREYLLAAEKIEKILKGKKFMFQREWNRKAIVLSIYPPRRAGGETGHFSPPKNIFPPSLREVMKEIIERIKPAPKDLEEKSLEAAIHIEDRIALIREMLLNKIKFNFRKILEKAGSKTEVIISFLAMLELAKQRDIIIDQDELFGEIEITRFEVGLKQITDNR
ncbi:MAG: segregation/condensation protein A [Patescibacteria group bacterium]|jgi:segregation and condensation protein A